MASVDANFCTLDDDQLRAMADLHRALFAWHQMMLPPHASHLMAADAIEELLSRRAQKTSGLPDLERSAAYEWACSVVEGNCTPLNLEDDPDWFDTSHVNPHAGEAINDALLILGLRGLLDRHPDNLNWIRLRDESEGL